MAGLVIAGARATSRLQSLPRSGAHTGVRVRKALQMGNRESLENRWACKRPVGSNPTPADSERETTAEAGEKNDESSC